jgi:hypothetical protein
MHRRLLLGHALLVVREAVRRAQELARWGRFAGCGCAMAGEMCDDCWEAC